MHTTLQRQIVKYLGSTDALARDQALAELFDAISKTYEGYEDSRKMIEHALDLSTTELNQKNRTLEEELDRSKQQKDEFEKVNKFMTGREIKMMELKKEIDQLKAQLAAKTTT